jgi:hypothetical protein
MSPYLPANQLPQHWLTLADTETRDTANNLRNDFNFSKFGDHHKALLYSCWVFKNSLTSTTFSIHSWFTSDNIDP